ncbi:MAG: phosphoribosylglycinamide formyltransferase [Bacillota bacterium]|jgi:phosphoribosylglycinamide formyltransferase-1|nr:phosphoribosylglycinamide formyltransferase [Clostridia bacterium]
MNLLKLAVLVSGRGSNLQAIIDGIKKGDLSATISVVISNCQNALALNRAREENIPTVFLDPKNFFCREDYDLALAEKIKEYEADLVVLAGFMRVLSPSFLDKFPLKVINIHPALLPSFPGTHGQKQALEYGVKVTGCTVHFVDQGVDTGPIIAQRAVSVHDDDTEKSLAERILREEHKLYPQVIQWIAEGRVKVTGRIVRVSGMNQGTVTDSSCY